MLRRYEPLQRDTANAVIAERTNAGAPMSRSQRWALTGSDTGPAAQAPLGRRQEGEQPRELQGVRYRWDPAPAERPAAPRGGSEWSSATRRARASRHSSESWNLTSFERQRDSSFRWNDGLGETHPAVSSRRSPASAISAFCSFSNARTSIWRMRSRLTS